MPNSKVEIERVGTIIWTRNYTHYAIDRLHHFKDYCAELRRKLYEGKAAEFVVRGRASRRGRKGRSTSRSQL